MALTKEQSIAQYGTEAYTAWGEAEAAADVAAHPEKRGSMGGGGDVTQMILNAWQERMDEYKQVAGEFIERNPFDYDEVLAQKTTLATEQLDPYYKQTLSDYLSGVERQRGRTTEDETRLLNELNQDVETYTERTQTNLELSLERAREGASRSGMLQSGQARREEGLLEVEAGRKTKDFMTTAGRQRAGYQRTALRTLEDLQREQGIKTRDIETERQAEVDILGSRLALEAGQKRAFGLQEALAPYTAQYRNYDILGGLI